MDRASEVVLCEKKCGLLELYSTKVRLGLLYMVRVVAVVVYGVGTLTTDDLVFTPGLDNERLNPALELGTSEKLSDTRRAARYDCRELTQVHAQHLCVVPTSHPVQRLVRKLEVL